MIVRLTRSRKLHRDIAVTRRFKGRPTFDDLVQMAGSLKPKPVRYFRAFVDRYYGAETRIFSQQDLQQLLESANFSERIYIQVKYKH